MTNLISRKFLIFLLFAAAIGNALLVKAQTYPVQVTTTLTPPYSVYLSDYGSATSNALQVFINLLELDRTNFRVKLRLTIEGAGITLSTRSTYIPQAIVLQGGIPEMLTGYDLRGYLNPDNLEFSGITKAEFLKSGKLPEGFYTFKFEVIEFIRNVRISSPMGGQASAWMVLNDPPLVNQPFNGDKLTVTNPQNVLFSWTPRHTASPNAAFTTEYEFRLVELYPGQTNPDIAIRSSNSLFTTTTTFTSLNYGIIDPTLTPGKKYAFRIRAYDTSGKDLFKNGGYSETYFFQYGDACSLPAGITAEALDAERIKVAWEPEIAHSKFVINLRKAGSRNFYSEENFSSAQIFPDLKPETQYEYQIQSYCGASPGEMSSIFTVSTPKMEEALVEAETKFACGADSPALGEEEQDCTIPLQKPLLPLDRMKQGDWGVIVSQVSVQPDGSYSGKGHMGVPMLNALNLRVRFENVRLNEHYRMIRGVVKTIYDDTNAPFSIGSVEEEEGEIGEEREELEGELGDEGEEDHEGDVVAENGEATENGGNEIPSDSVSIVTNSEGSNGSSTSTGEGSGEASEDPGTGTEVAAGDSAGTGSEVASGGGAGTEEGVEGDSTNSTLVYDYFIIDDDVWLRKSDNPGVFISPTEKADLGTQVALLAELEVGEKEVAKLKVKNSDDTIFITNKSDYLIKVKQLEKELKYKMSKDFTAVKLPYSTNNTEKTYKKDVEFTAYKSCGNYLRVKGEGEDDIEGHWIDKESAIVDCGTGFCCQKCGKDLTLALADLQTIYSSKASPEYVTHLNTALKKGGFNTCTSHAHFFSQSQAEVGSNFHLDEIPNYRLHTVLELHRSKQSLKDFYNQSFWDDETYLDYFQFYVFKEAPDDYKGSKYEGDSEKTFTWGPDNTKLIKVPTLFAVKKDEKYQKVTFSKTDAKKRNKKLFSYLYANKYENGAPSTEDGWNFRGKGLIHLTWRENYRRASALSGDKLDYRVDWETNYDDVSDKPKDAVYSAVAYFLFKLNTEQKFKLLHDDTKAWDVSKWVNGLNPSTQAPNGWPSRRDNFNTLIGDLFKCD